jgi:hypothetical protein
MTDPAPTPETAPAPAMLAEPVRPHPRRSPRPLPRCPQGHIIRRCYVGAPVPGRPRRTRMVGVPVGYCVACGAAFVYPL